MQDEQVGGKELDWLDFGSRFYDPELGCWHSIDNQAATMPGISSYANCFNNPISFVDPNGENPLVWAAVFAGNYIKNVLDNKINNKMSWEDAFYNSSFIVDGNFSPSPGQFSHPQIEAHNTAKGAEKYSQLIDESFLKNYWNPGYLASPGSMLAPLNGMSSRQEVIPNSEVTPWNVGVEWLTGEGPRHRNFTNGDMFTEMLRQHEHVLMTKASISGMIPYGTMKGKSSYSLSGIQGVGKYLKDYSTLATFGTTGNLTVTYRGSYDLQWEVITLNGNSATVQFLVENSSTIQSAFRPPVIGYYSWWQNSVGSWLNRKFSSGPMSPIKQTFLWNETINW
ncbi:hypothetical protein EYV94_27815 [Puteibacter caeruleilacunae]|nr:hypothetical protein EYV94_27815 [Puteibacter caeruleilacunae]